jgi:hypothetical protein
MSISRTRNFYYKIYESDHNKINERKSILEIIDCKYHIIKYEFETKDSFIEGILFLKNAKTISSVKNLLLMPDHKIHILQQLCSKKDKPKINELIFSYKSSKHFWEKGTAYNYYKKEEIPEPVINKTQDIHRNNILEIIEQMQQDRKMVNELLLQNKELIQKVSEPKIINNHTTNQKININIFLKESCKDAINFNDFIDNIQIEDSDLLFAKDHGFAKSIMNVIKKELNKCDIYTRPLHCTDMKRETLHIKEKEGWITETGKQSLKIQKAIRNISHKKNKKLGEYIENHPEYTSPTSKKYEEYEPFMKNVIGFGCGQEYEKNEKQVVQDVAKQVFISHII